MGNNEPCYLEFIDKHKISDGKTRKSVASLLIGFSLGQLFKTDIADDKQYELYELEKVFLRILIQEKLYVNCLFHK